MSAFVCFLRGNHRRAVAAAFMTLLLLLPVLAACGKRGDPMPPEDAPVTYPRTYPRG